MSRVKLTLLALAAPVGACVTRSPDASPAIPIGYNFSYQARQREAVDLIQAFDDGQHTYLQFNHGPAQVSIREDRTGPQLAYQTDAHYVTLEGLYENLIVTVNDRSARILKDSEAENLAKDSSYAMDRPLLVTGAVADALPTTIAPVGVPESVQTMQAHLRVRELNRDIGDLETRIEELTEQLNAARHEESASITMRATTGIPRLIVLFDDNSAQPQIEEPLIHSLAAAARAANRIYLHGHTDAYVASETGSALAIRRAVAVRELLVANQVSASRVRLFYRGAGSFAANNSTDAGKAQNRRVEIELRKW